MSDKTTLKVDRETWKRLQDRKDEPGKTFDDVINELIDQAEEGDS